MDINTVEREITDSIRNILKSKGVDESHIKMKVKSKTTSAEMPVRAQGIKDSDNVVEWPKAVVTTVKMKLSVKFVAPGKD